MVEGWRCENHSIVCNFQGQKFFIFFEIVINFKIIVFLKFISRKHGIGQNLNIKEAARIDQVKVEPGIFGLVLSVQSPKF